MKRGDLLWLAGYLEGEGSFLRPPPSAPNSPRIAASTTDEDVIRRVGKLFRVKHCRIRLARSEANGWKPAWRIELRGRRAVALMTILYPLMGERRRVQIKASLAAYDSKKAADRLVLTPEKAVELRRRALAGENAKKLADEFGVKLGMVYDTKNRRAWAKARARRIRV